MSATSGTHLTTSRINRLFRPLRAKCTNLAAFSAQSSHPKHTVSVTYSNNPRNNSRKTLVDNDTPPLAILQPPESLGSRIHLDKASLENLQLSKKIYEVRDAFRNVVQVALGSPHAGQSSGAPRIMSLAAMCAVVVGENIQNEVLAFQHREDSDGDMDDHEAAEFLEELYEGVPTHYRSYTVISHALSFVLETCPHHSTLLAALLDVCFFHSLVPETHILLRAMFCTALLPTVSSAPCPLTHPAHSNYLTALRATCCTRPSSNRGAAYSRLTDTTFTGIFVEVLTESASGRTDAWTSKAVARLARELRALDFGVFVLLCSGIAQSISDTERSLARKRGKKIEEDRYEHRLRSRLSRWAKSMLDRLHPHELEEDSDADLEIQIPISNDEFQSIVDFLLYATSLNLHIAAGPSTPTGFSLADVLICLATSCLASPLRPTVSPADCAALHDMLRTTQPTTETYNLLVAHIFTPPPVCPLFNAAGPDYTPTPPPSGQNNGGMPLLRALAAPLRAQNLYRLEASLCASALRHIEGLCSASRPASLLDRPAAIADSDAIRAELVARVELAEARCFGAQAVANNNNNGVGGPSAAREEWEWEEMVGAWVHKTPRDERGQAAAKRRRLDGAPGEVGDRRETRSRTSRRRTVAGSSGPRAAAAAIARRSLPHVDSRRPATARESSSQKARPGSSSGSAEIQTRRMASLRRRSPTRHRDGRSLIGPGTSPLSSETRRRTALSCTRRLWLRRAMQRVRVLPSTRRPLIRWRLPCAVRARRSPALSP
ncbi:hypothetical protein B0H21DRAFT_791568 [Amylocystis lapponica]|nr:hypothetical protein B0H21DRAFT_791568 [Amylocystis lapponica]